MAANFVMIGKKKLRCFKNYWREFDIKGKNQKSEMGAEIPRWGMKFCAT